MRSHSRFVAAILTEVVEIIIDFGRLVLYFQDPGKIDFYHNVRWNSSNSSNSTMSSLSNGGSGASGMVIRRFISVLPVYLLLSSLWLVVFIGNIDPKKLLANPSDFSDESPSERTYILIDSHLRKSLVFVYGDILPSTDVQHVLYYSQWRRKWCGFFLVKVQTHRSGFA